MNGIYVNEVAYRDNNNKYALNLAYEIANTIYSGIYNQDPSFMFDISGKLQKSLDKILAQYGMDPQKLNIRKIERSLEYVTKKSFKEMKSTQTNQRCVVDSVWAGFGVTKMGYNLVINEKLQTLKTDLGDKFTKAAESLQFSDMIEQDEPFKIRINPMDILLPPSARSLNELNYVIQNIYISQKDAFQLYNKTLPITANGKYTIEKEKADLVHIKEFHSLDPRDPYVYVTAEGWKGFLETPKVAVLYDGKKVKSPFQFLWTNDGIDSIYPKPDLSYVEDQIREINFLVSRRVELIKKVRAMYVAKGTLDPKEKKKIESGEDGSIITLDDPKFDIKQLEMLTLGAEFYNNISAIRAEMFEVLGLTDYTVGGKTQERKATEAQFVQRAAMTRVAKRIRMVDQFVFNQVDTFVEIMKEFKVIERVYEIKFSEDDIVEFHFSKALLETADADIQVIPGSTVELDQTARINKLMQLSQVAQGFPETANKRWLYKKMVEELGYDPTEALLPEQQPQQEIPLGEDGRTPKIGGNVPTTGQPSVTPEQAGVLPSIQ